MAKKQRVVVATHDLRSVYNTTGSAIDKGTILTLAATPVAPGEVDLAVAATRNFYGVAYNDIPAGAWGDAQIRGVALVISSGAIAAATRVISDANGKAAAAADAVACLGQLLEAGVTDTLTEIELAGPGAMPAIA